MNRACSLTAALLAAAALFAGCGDDSDEDGGSPTTAQGGTPTQTQPAPQTTESGGAAEAGGPQAALEKFLEAYGAGDGKTACGLMTASARKESSEGALGPCEERVSEGPAVGQGRTYEVTDVQTSGDTATATASSNQGVSQEVELKQEGGDWKVDTALGEGSVY